MRNAESCLRDAKMGMCVCVGQADRWVLRGGGGDGSSRKPTTRRRGATIRTFRTQRSQWCCNGSTLNSCWEGRHTKAHKEHSLTHTRTHALRAHAHPVRAECVPSAPGQQCANEKKVPEEQSAAQPSLTVCSTRARCPCLLHSPSFSSSFGSSFSPSRCWQHF